MADYKIMVKKLQNQDVRIKVAVCAVLLVGIYWIYGIFTASTCSALANSEWQITVNGQDSTAQLIINEAVAYADYPNISRMIGTTKTAKSEKSFNMVLCFHRQNKIEIQDIPLPKGIGNSESFSTSIFNSSDFKVKLQLYHRSKGAIEDDYTGIMQRTK